MSGKDSDNDNNQEYIDIPEAERERVLRQFIANGQLDGNLPGQLNADQIMAILQHEGGPDALREKIAALATPADNDPRHE